MEILFLIGRIIYGGFFIYNGINHFENSAMLTGYATSKGVPMAKQSVYFTGILLLLGGAGMILGIYVKLAVLCLAAFLIPVSFMMHAFWKITDPGQKAMEKVQFTKNMALLGAALMTLAILEPWSLNI